MGKGFLHKGTFLAYVCGDRCKALRWRMQCFALANAMLCVGGCKALRWQLQSFASETDKTGIEIVSPILDKRKGKKDSLHMGHSKPPGNFC